MSYVVKMPKLGLEMEQGTVLEWYVEEGSEIEKGDVLLEVESEKSIGEVEAREDGLLRLLTVGEGEIVTPGTPIGIVAAESEDVTDLEAEFDGENGVAENGDAGGESMDETEDGEAGAAAAGSTAEPTAAGDAGAAGPPSSGEAASDVKASPRAKRRAEETGVTLATVEGTGPQGAITADDVNAAASEATADEAETGATGVGADAETGAAAEEVRASPRARERASDLGVSLPSVKGTGPGGAVTAEDVERAAESSSEGESTTAEPTASGRLAAGESAAAGAGRYHTSTLVTDGQEADRLIEATTLAEEAFDLDVSVTDVLLVAVSEALSAHPTLNATLADGTHHCHEHQHVVLAAGDGQSAVVVPDVTERSFADLVAARRGRLDGGDSNKVGNDGGGSNGGADEHTGKTVTFVLGGDAGATLEPPTVAGLAVDASRRRALPAENGAGVSLSRYLSCTLYYDPRAVGDGTAADFLETVLDSIERAPELLLWTYER
jgi:pyruvate dehydrogenase E2 component (dihydrolipoamide acetyltransferase)